MTATTLEELRERFPEGYPTPRRLSDRVDLPNGRAVRRLRGERGFAEDLWVVLMTTGTDNALVYEKIFPTAWEAMAAAEWAGRE